MRPVRNLLGLLLAAACVLPAVAQGVGSRDCLAGRDGRMVCPPPDGRCVTDRYGEVVCSPSGGGIATNRYRDAVCGPGRCVTDQFGDVFCSSAARGAASLDRYGKAACTDGCVAASAAQCVKPAPAN